ncbi:MAG TPA: hypothetical protein VK487_05885 [Candidatus Bathyarchaeia archaeon]|nr:hypothetical protein [Candidatus Bathyarchaeia archaeon]
MKATETDFEIQLGHRVSYLLPNPLEKGVSCNTEKGKEDAHERYTKSHAK